MNVTYGQEDDFSENKEQKMSFAKVSVMIIATIWFR